eukprot:241787-Prorocentrum_minimum.AAC.1
MGQNRFYPVIVQSIPILPGATSFIRDCLLEPPTSEAGQLSRSASARAPSMVCIGGPPCRRPPGPSPFGR